ncbi:alanine racemase [Thermosediminibacter litoriperuensis]|uniref:Alanine racemase n=1 Tax=Thermosediminibacter litoriperuensis TaxID=291989 RepID=A0A5S5AW11_9FIRM|nr:alanine racemase [Thermosediminibacter litoriperuensis]TYP56717.1 alanine racemase [Thermosediminibacter litoriperuensis]
MESYKKYMEVDLRALRRNYETIRREAGVPVMAVVKGDAYGHGAKEVALTLQEAGVKWFGVEFLEEAVELREAGIEGRVLCFTGPVTREDCEIFIEKDVTPTIYNLDRADLLNKTAARRGVSCRVHLKFDTGMGRFGFLYEDLDRVIDGLRSFSHLIYEGAYTHFAEAFAKRPDYTLYQLSVFQRILGRLEQSGINVAIRHAANSVAAMDFPEARLDMVRVGSALYGATMFKNPSVRLERVARLKVRIIDVKSLPRGSYIGYGRSYRTTGDMVIGILPVGYFEGLKVQRRNNTFTVVGLLRNIYHEIRDFLNPVPLVFMDGRPLRILGRIGLQLTAVDLTGTGAGVGDEVTVAIDPVYFKYGNRLYTESRDVQEGLPAELEKGIIESGGAK